MIKKYLEYISESKLEKDYEYIMLSGDEKIKIDIDIDIVALIRLDNECDSIKIGDDVLVVYFNNEKFQKKYNSLKYSIFRFIVKNTYGELGYILNAGEDGQFGEEYILSDADLVVRVDTYDDFVEPKKRIKDND